MAYLNLSQVAALQAWHLPPQDLSFRKLLHDWCGWAKPKQHKNSKCETQFWEFPDLQLLLANHDWFLIVLRFLSNSWLVLIFIQMGFIPSFPTKHPSEWQFVYSLSLLYWGYWIKLVVYANLCNSFQRVFFRFQPFWWAYQESENHTLKQLGALDIWMVGLSCLHVFSPIGTGTTNSRVVLEQLKQFLVETSGC